MTKDKTYRIKSEYYVGEFTGQVNSHARRKYIGVGSDYDDATMGEWLTIPQATKLRDALNEILGVATSGEEA